MFSEFKLLVVNIVGLIFCLSIHGYVKEDSNDVIFVNLLWRHGARTPNTFYANDPYKDMSYWPEGVGQLTNEGKRQHYRLGKWLRKRYASLLTPMYNRTIIYVRSTDWDRTLMSAQCNLAGMFPPKNGNWNRDLDWQPIPIHTIPKDLDKVLAGTAPCPAFDEEMSKVLNSTDIQELYKKYEGVFKFLKKYGGDSNVDWDYIHDVYDTLTIEKSYGLPLPHWTEGNGVMKMMYMAARYKFVLDTWTKKLARLKVGLLVKEMIQNMINKTEHQSNKNVHIYSAHDVTIARFLNGLGMYDLIIPPYAACVMVELHAKPSGHYVMIYYRNSSTIEEPRLLALPGCVAACPLDEFISLCQPIIPENWDRECQML